MWIPAANTEVKPMTKPTIAALGLAAVLLSPSAIAATSHDLILAQNAPVPEKCAQLTDQKARADCIKEEAGK